MTALRPDYTKLLAKKLAQQSLNVFGERGHGQERLLKDLSPLVDSSYLVFSLNMKNHAAHYKGFISALACQLQQHFPAKKEKTISNLNQLLSAYDELASGRHMVLMLCNFDALLDNPELDPAYNVAFFNNLNALRNQGHRLVCTTVNPHSNSQVFVDKKVHSNSWLDLRCEPLPKLTREEITNELGRRELNLSPEHTRQMINHIQQHPQPYCFLEFAADKLTLKDSEALRLDKRVKKWQKEFAGMEKLTLFKILHKINKWGQRLAIVTGINKLKTPFVLLIELVKKYTGKS